jgi:hypothetical protein
LAQGYLAFPQRFQAAVRAVEELQRYERYLGAFIFGSLARGEGTEVSDCDVQVIVDEEASCKNINHPVIGGVKLDLTFLAFAQLEGQIEQAMGRRERIPWIVKSVILFDKLGQLAALQERAKKTLPLKTQPEDVLFVQFMFFHSNNKVERNLESDPVSALLSMHVGLNDFLHYHYQIHQRWWVSSKRLMADLRSWDLPLAELVERFVTTGEPRAKFACWSAIIEHILRPLGGRQPIEENNCLCQECQRDLAMLSAGI